MLARRVVAIWRHDARRWDGAPDHWGPGTGHPNEAPRNQLVYRQLAAALEFAAQRYARGRLLDVGCGAKPWRDQFAPHVAEHIGADRADSLHGLRDVDLISDVYDIPLQDGSVDTILMTEVLEHLERPQEALVECARLLVPGGHLIATTPFSWPLHEEPRDFFRYSPHGLRHLTEEAGLEVLQVQPLSGIWSTLALHFSYGLQRYAPHARRLVALLSILAQRLAWACERVDRQELLSWNHLLIARRP